MGLCLLRLSPAIFWSLTPIEFHAMAGGFRPKKTAMTRGSLETLIQSFPDDGAS